ncbi:MAG: hypothetical protein KIT27_11425 [Legionellales bacterium]|nr:hypothetical protein [Legionellales bacterium]
MKFNFLKMMILSLIIFCNSVFAAPVIYLGIQPTKQVISFGANQKAYSLLFYVVNQTSAAVPISNFSLNLTTTPAPTPNPLSNITYTNDCNNVIPASGPQGVCNIHVNFLATGNQAGVAPTLAHLNYTFSFDYGARNTQFTSNSFTLSFATGAAVALNARTFTFNNKCTYPVNFGIASSAVESITAAIAGDSYSCAANSDCYPGSKCIAISPTVNHCFWENPAPTGNNYTLAANTGTTTVTFPVYDNGIAVQWSGGIAARTHCVNGVCETADCGASTPGTNSGCELGKGFQQPVTAAEFTLLGESNSQSTVSGNVAQDTYDVTIINGFNVPVKMAPTDTTLWGGASAPYTCGNPGDNTAQSPLGACNWTFTPPSNDYVWVRYDAGAANCLPGGGCAAGGEECGLSYNPAGASGAKFAKKCGIPLGYWTADSVCALDENNATAPFNCTTVVQNGLKANVLYGCSSGELKNSCYSNGAVNTCCGCVNWNTVAGITVPAAPITNQCLAQNTVWQTLSQPKIEFLKKACPTAYTYPYDDASSTFSCAKLNSSKVNVVNYTITFCPAG